MLKDDPEVVQATHLSYFEAGEGSALSLQLQCFLYLSLT